MTVLVLVLVDRVERAGGSEGKRKKKGWREGRKEREVSKTPKAVKDDEPRN